MTESATQPQPQETSKPKPPLVEAGAKAEFQRLLPDIQASIDAHSLSISAEEYWQEFLGAITFLDFDSYVEIVDRVIDDHMDQGVINCYFDNMHAKLQESGPVDNSDSFMLRLLRARIQDRGVALDVQVFQNDKRRMKEIQTLAMIDDALFSGLQKLESMDKLPLDKAVLMYVVGSTSTARDLIKSLIDKRPPANHGPNGQLTVLRELRSVADSLSPAALQVYKDLWVQKAVAKSKLDPDRALRSALLNFDEVASRKPLVSTPFNVIDDTSTEEEWMRPLIPVRTKSYVQPEMFFESKPEELGARIAGSNTGQ